MPSHCDMLHREVAGRQDPVQFDQIKRREFITLLGGASAAWPFAAGAQAKPVIGFVNGASADSYVPFVRAFRHGLGEAGYIEGQNVMIEYRWADGQYDRLPGLISDLVHRQVAIIAATSTPAALAAKALNITIPVVFTTASDPVRLGLVASLSRPGGNITGATQLNLEVSAKRLELLRELIPGATDFGYLVNPANPVFKHTSSLELETAARTLGLTPHVLNASSEQDLERVFASFAQLRVSGLVIGAGDAFFNSRSRQLGALAARHNVPAIYQGREFVASGGLVSYGGSVADSYRLAGVYAGRILKGAKPADLPVQQSTKVEMIINLKTAKALGLTIPLPLLGRADEVIE
jgi:putative ABC transport system substrate-binding protein